MTHDPLAWIDDELATLDAVGLLRRLRHRVGDQGAEVEIDGRRVLNFGSNDYLNLASDPRLAEAVRQALANEGSSGWGSGASPLILGRNELHLALEQTLAQFEETEAALVFPSGAAANHGTVAALVSRGDIVFSDAKNHASIIDGCRLSGARVQVYPHGDVEYLANMMRQAGNFRRRMIVTDSLFSMDGDFAPLVALADLAEQFDCMLLVDEAHATGVFGAKGRGVCEHFGVEDRVHVRIGTLSKALGCAGGFVAGPQSLIDLLANRARTYVFSTAQPAAWCAASLQALEIVRRERERRDRLLLLAADLRQRLSRQGWQIGASESQIIPVYLGEPELTMRIASRLLEEGLFVPGIRPPSVPAGESLLRISLTAGHKTEQIERLVGTLAKIRDKK